jgi:hypothetical protein
MEKRLVDEDVSKNRTTGSELEATDPTLAADVGAKLRLTVAVPGGGLLAPGFAVNCCQTPNCRVSERFGLVLMTSHTAEAEPFTTVSSAKPVAPPFTVVVGLAVGERPLVSAADSPWISNAYDDVLLPDGAGVLLDVVFEARFVTETKMRTPAGMLLNEAFRRVP